MVTSRKTTEYLRQLACDAPEFVRSEQFPLLGAESAGLLRLLTVMSKPELILEIGTNIGASGITMLKACSQAELYTIEINEETAALARRNFESAGVGERAHILQGRAEDILPYLKDDYGLIFLDGPKGQYSFMSTYLLPRLQSGGVLVCDNVLFRGMVTGDKKVRARKHTLVKKLDEFLHGLCADETIITSVLPIGDGMSVSYKL